MIDKYVADKTEEIKLFDAVAPDVTGPANTDEKKLKEANRRALGEYLVRSLAAKEASDTVDAQKGVVKSFQKTVDD